jgi:uncharacterized protein YgiM (DUF1202 family)
MKKITRFFLAAAIWLLTACALAPSAAPTFLPATKTPLPPPKPPTPTATALPTVTPTATFTTTETPFAPFAAAINTQDVNLRAGPGYLFPVLRILHEGETVSILGKAPGGEWFQVRTQEDIEGWIILWLLNANTDLQEAPVIEPRNVLLIRGRLRDQRGTPMRGIVFTAARSRDQAARGNNALTDANGGFYSFMPLDAAGDWMVFNSGISCNSNAWKDARCTAYKDYYRGVVEPESQSITLPSTEVLEFTWT